MSGELRWCTHCQRLRPVELFVSNERMRDGLHSWCRDCTRAAVRRWREENREYVEAYNRRRREEYAAGHEPLERVCANPECGRTFTPTRRDAGTCSKACRGRLAYLRRKGLA